MRARSRESWGAVKSALSAPQPAELVHNRLHDGVLEVAIECSIDRLLDQENAGQLFLAVDPEMSPERAVPAETPRRGASTCRDRIHDHFDGQPEAHTRATAVRYGGGIEIADMIGAHQVNRPRTEQPLAIQLAAVDQHL